MPHLRTHTLFLGCIVALCSSCIFGQDAVDGPSSTDASKDVTADAKGDASLDSKQLPDVTPSDDETEDTPAPEDETEDEKDPVFADVDLRAFFTGNIQGKEIDGIRGADQHCNDQARNRGIERLNAQQSQGFRAFLVRLNVREACSGLPNEACTRSRNWPVEADRTYGDPDSELVFVTDDQARISSVTRAASSVSTYFTGLREDWGTKLVVNTCDGWNNSLGRQAGVGDATKRDVSKFISSGNVECVSSHPILCVESALSGN